MNRFIFLKFIFLIAGCLALSSCLKVEDSEGALNSIAPDFQVEGEWYVLKWMEEEKTAESIKPTDEADVTLEAITRKGQTGYKFTSKDPEKQKDLESLWAMNFGDARFFLSEFPEGDCGSCTLLMYTAKDNMIYAYVLKIQEAQEFLKKNYPNATAIVATNSGDIVKELSMKTFDDESKGILKDMAQHTELWETAVILKKAD